jgi:SpoVK/Ycf46/Vps4 family AAA+-type ATPase
MDQKFDPKTGLTEMLLMPGLDASMLVSQLMTLASPAPITWQDVTHLEQQARTARNLLAGALRSARPGVNVLFYGVTGAGKTALAHLLAQDLGASLYIAGCGSELDESTDADDRLSSLMLGHCLLRDGSAIMLFDELEDLFRWNWHGAQGERARGEASVSKQWFNHLLETNPVPTIWISNRIEGIDPAFLRRFMYAIEFNPLGLRQRARVLARYLDEADGARIEPAEVDALAARYRSMPAQIATAVSAARLCAADARPDCAALEAVLAPIEKLVQGEPRGQAFAFDRDAYDIEALNSRENLRELADSVIDWKPGPSGALSICLYGPPGTGKTQYVRYLAHRMDRPVLLRRVSDIVRPYVGQTEQEIAAAFRQAEQDGSILLFDEVDSFLRERRAAKHSWEVTAVNEFLQQLEAYRGIVACTTNLWREIDPAALRRFMIKAEFLYLRLEQAVALFKLNFAAHLPENSSADLDLQLRAALRPLTTLTPGDLAIVARRVSTLRRSYSLAALIELVLEEVRAKAGRPRAIGFTRAESG